jgi:hypothetical protein
MTPVMMLFHTGLARNKIIKTIHYHLKMKKKGRQIRCRAVKLFPLPCPGSLLVLRKREKNNPTVGEYTRKINEFLSTRLNYQEENIFYSILIRKPVMIISCNN